MKKSVAFILLLFLFLGTVHAQKSAAPAMVPAPVPVDSITHLITYESVVETPGVNAQVLYNRTIDWFYATFKNPTEVIREKDSIKFKVVGKPRFKISNPPDKNGTKTDGGLIQYTITVAAKDGRFKYELTEFNWKQQSYYPSERWMDTKAQMYTPLYNEYLLQLHQEANRIITTLKEALTHAKSVKKTDDW